MADTYWQRRQRRSDERMAKREKAMEGRVRRVYERQLRDLERQIADYYERYGEDGVLRYRSMLQTMDDADRRLLMEDCEEFARRHPEHADMVEIRKSVYRLDRLEGLRASARLRLAEATAEASDGLDAHFAQDAVDAINAVAETMGYGSSFYSVDSEVVRQFVGTAWSDGKSYSDSIWESSAELASYVERDLSKALVRGASYQSLCREMQRRFEGQGVSNIMRVIQTEGTYVARQAQAAEMVREGFEEYFVDPVGDERTCSECRGVGRRSHEEPFRFDAMDVGTNFPPLHPRCRCEVNPAVEDWEEWARRRRAEHRAQMATAGVSDEAVARRFGAERGVGAKRAENRTSSNVVMRKKQFGKKMTKHAKDWGLNPGDGDDRAEFERIIEGIIDCADDVSYGEWRGQPGPCAFYRKGQDIVIVNARDEFVTVMRGGASNVRYQRSVGRLGD